MILYVTQDGGEGGGVKVKRYTLLMEKGGIGDNQMKNDNVKV